MEFKKLNTPGYSPSFPNEGVLVLRFERFILINSFLCIVIND